MFCHLEHQLLSFYKNQKLPVESSIYLAVSGGLDSMAMLALHQKLKKALKIHLTVVHFHHGEVFGKENIAQNNFRNKTYKALQEYCEKQKIAFISNALKSSTKQSFLSNTKQSPQKEKHFNETEEIKNLEVAVKNSEAEYRKCRYDYFEEILLLSKFDSKLLVTAHTADDLLETRLMRLMRGVGSQGLVAIKPVSIKENHLLVRPLLTVMRSSLQDYVHQNAVPFFEDPSNKNDQFLRNWLRLKVLPIIAQKNKKYLQNMSQSLNAIASDQKEDIDFLQKVVVKNKIHLDVFYSLSVVDQKRTLAHYLYCNKVKNYSMGHVLELLKYLNAPKKEQFFHIARQGWKLKQPWLYILDNSSKSIRLNTD